MPTQKALLIVDVQNDFCPGGSLGVPGGDRVIPVLNRYIELFSRERFPIIASRDWHPKVTGHFEPHGGMWPPHCVAGTKGAEFHPQLRLLKDTAIVSKGLSPNEDAYSAFQAKDSSGSSLVELLEHHRIGELYVGGLATDYCVKHTVLDALALGFTVYLLVDAVAGVESQPLDIEHALSEMRTEGARLVSFSDVEDRLLVHHARTRETAGSGWNSNNNA